VTEVKNSFRLAQMAGGKKINTDGKCGQELKEGRKEGRKEDGK